MKILKGVLPERFYAMVNGGGYYGNYSEERYKNLRDIDRRGGLSGAERGDSGGMPGRVRPV
jgi:hypothetical protein